MNNKTKDNRCSWGVLTNRNNEIKELEQKLAGSEEEKKAVQAELNKLRLAEFEEDMATESNQQLLKG